MTGVQTCALPICHVIRGEIEGDATRAEALGVDLANELLTRGARTILDKVYGRA